MLFAGLWALYRNRPIVAAVLMTISALVHEITILTVLPIFAMAALRQLPFGRTQEQSWRLYNIGDVLIYLAPFAILMILAFALLHLTDAGLTDPANGRTVSTTLVTVSHTLAAAIAVTSSLLLAFAGWDQDRWGFLLVTNFVIVLWLRLRDSQRELGRTQAVILVATMLIVTHIPMGYFDGFAPRPLQWPAIQAFFGDLVRGKVFIIPPR